MSSNAKVVTFENYEKQIKSPFIIYVRFEAIRVPKSKSVLVHQPCGFAYSIKCSFDSSLSKCESYCGEDCAKVLWENLQAEAKIISHRMKSKVEPRALNDEEKSLFDKIRHCYFCGDEFHGDKCEDFFQPSGEFLGAAHKRCREKKKLSKCIPVVVSKYGMNFLLKKLSGAERARTLFVGNDAESKYGFMRTFPNSLTLKFINEEMLLDEEIELDSILTDSKKKSLKKRFKADFDLAKSKTFFPFSHVDSFGKFDENKLPPKAGFYDQLEDEDISDENYQRSVKIWERFKCQTISDYVKVCLESSVLLLEDVFENFRMLCLDKYGLDPAHYCTIASFAWDAMLRYTRVKLESLQKRDMIDFIKNNIRGGIVQCPKRYAKANNKYCNYYNSEKPSNFIIYLDANNLAGWAMSQKLPFSEFEWLNKTQINEIKSKLLLLEDDSDYGYIFEVDLDYPKELHQKHNDLPFCCEPLTIPPPPTAPNLTKFQPVLNFYKKKNYVIDYRNLKQCLDNGLVLSKIHRILKFKQSNWLEPYITYNTKLRARSTNEFEKKLYKWLNNSVYGKTIQKATNDKPFYAGFCILELSKKFMYDFHYKHMLPRYKDKINLLYMDTDSFIYEIQTFDFYKDLKSDKELLSMFDTSDLDSKWGIPAKNKKALGKMKVEYGGRIILELCGVGAKVYCLDVEGEEIKKAVGMKKYVKRKYISMKDYRDCVMDDIKVRKTFLETAVSDYEMNTVKVTKTVLSPGDRKRCIMMDKISTRAWGYEE